MDLPEAGHAGMVKKQKVLPAFKFLIVLFLAMRDIRKHIRVMNLALLSTGVNRVMEASLKSA